MKKRSALAIVLLLGSTVAAEKVPPGPARPYVDAIRKINEDHARRPGKETEADLAKRLSPAVRMDATKKGLLKGLGSPEAAFACGEAALDLDLMADFELIRAVLEVESPEKARQLGIALSRPRFLLRGTGGVKKEYLESFAQVLEAVLGAYDEVFGFEEWSKVPGKKLRVRLHPTEKDGGAPHFAPEFPFHSEIDFPVPEGDVFRSPTPDGKFLFYGLCHELGHVFAMWGNAKKEEDHHAWAHYTGLVIVEKLSEKKSAELKDARWRSLKGEMEKLKGKTASLADREGVLALLFALHEKVGPKEIGKAMNALDRQDRRLRINRVRYYTFKELEQSLLGTVAPDKRQAVKQLFSFPVAGKA